jgi:streptomycin 6-kinase
MSELPLDPLTRGRIGWLGESGAAWQRGLPDLLADLLREWELRLSDMPAGRGSNSYVCAVERADGTPAVLKLAVDDDGLAQQAAVLHAADGRGFARLYAYDAPRQALLLERLGPPLRVSGRAVTGQLGILADLLRVAWQVPLEIAPPVAPGEDKASGLHRLIVEFDDQLGGICPPPAKKQALAYAETRAAAFDPAGCVVVHGDPHPDNALSSLQDQDSYRFVDPDGFRCEAGYDLGVALRDWCAELGFLDRREARTLARTYCSELASRAGEDEDVVWQWGFIERVSTGLYATALGSPGVGRPFLQTAALLAD